jgi:hypothetical protein
MCDYSLHGIENRLAREGEVLVVHRFYSGSKGLTSPNYLKPAGVSGGIIATLKRMFSAYAQPCAVCIPDGARLVLHGIDLALRRAHDLASVEPVTFRQLSANDYAYRDAVEFKNGLKIRLQDLEIGQVFEVLSLASEPVDVEAVHSAEFATDLRAVE